ncbi:MAG: SprT family zinc-dependent metalloprotease [Oscillospiraceae bacterium]
MKRSIIFENTTINYELTYKNVKNINLRIHSNSSIFVSANKSFSPEYIDLFVFSHGKMILNSLLKFKKIASCTKKELEYKNGEQLELLGKSLTLKIIESKKESVKIFEDTMILAVKDENNFKGKQKLIQSFLKDECAKVFAEILENTKPKLKNYKIPNVIIKIRKMKSRWGSCQPKTGIVTLNSQLINAPIGCIEYVVLHELCHFVQPNHSKDFYSLVSAIMPDYKERKKLLNTYILIN